ncbi:MAG: cupin domain-containing protein [Rhodospirillales bacterium]|nr:cupin domain-containing protein [Rhodospirillales bacterium]
MTASTHRRIVVRPDDAAFVPYDRYGEPVPGMYWVNISLDRDTGCGMFLLRMDPGSRSLPHEHVDYEEFHVLKGALVDDDGSVFGPGAIVSFRPGTCHSSTAPEGCTLLVSLRCGNRLLSAEEAGKLPEA